MKHPIMNNRYSRIKGYAEFWSKEAPVENQLTRVDIDRELQIMEQYINPYVNLCPEYGRKHGLKPTFKDLKTSIDV
jgi:hypothetical protein